MPPLTEVPARVHGDPCLAPAHVLSREIAARRLSPVDLMDALLARIAAHDPKLHAFDQGDHAHRPLALGHSSGSAS